jgi:hypothetical protein
LAFRPAAWGGPTCPERRSRGRQSAPPRSAKAADQRRLTSAATDTGVIGTGHGGEAMGTTQVPRGICILATRSHALAAIAGVTLAASAVVPAAAPIRPPQLPVLRWEERSDWTNVKSDVSPAAVGDGHTEDTVAIQNALAGVRDGSVLYVPPGTYRITAPLALTNPTGARWIGGLIVGSGRDTKWVWDGADGGTMLLLNGMAYSRFIGLELDGRGKAGVGFHYQATQGFQTTTASS